ncbi:MAG: hypothetical protein LBU35_03050 [Holosporales bacterium]|nr:hypothetical protein [Holosporales bacterium]
MKVKILALTTLLVATVNCMEIALPKMEETPEFQQQIRYYEKYIECWFEEKEEMKKNVRN